MKKRKQEYRLTREGLLNQFTAHAEDMYLSVDVFSEGPVNAEVAFVGEGPGETEVRQGRPFIGGAGKVLWDNVGKFGFHRENVYVTNVVKRQISLSRKGNEKHVVHRDELDKWIGMLQWELGQLPNLKTVFVLGNYALEALAQRKGITDWRGSVIDAEMPNGKPGHIVCAFNPAYLTPGRELRLEPTLKMDAQKLSLVTRGKFIPHEIEKIINPTYKEALALVRDFKKAKLPIALDIEAINQELACVGLSNNPHRAVCINLRDMTTNRFTTSQEVDILYALKDLCESHKIIAQNAQFDSYFCWMQYLLKFSAWFDILLAHHTIFPRLPHSLAFMVAQYTTHPYYKDEHENWKEGGDIDRFWEYNCCDAALTYACFEPLHRALKQQGLDKFFFDHVMRAQPHLVQATANGVLVDAEIKEVVTEQVQADVAKALNEFHDYVHQLTGEDDYFPNPNSWPQMQELYFNKLKLEGRGRSTDEENRHVMMTNPKTPPLAKEMLAAVDRFKSEDKYRGTYAESRVSADGRFRCEYKQFGVTRAPGRKSSSSLLVTKEGGNMQNQPVRARSAFIADPGCVFVYFDLMQAESQVVSFRADIPTWKEQYARAKVDKSYDAHRALASDMFRMPYDQVPKEDWDEDNKPTKRYIGKRCRHGLNYRMQKYRLSVVTELPYHVASQAYHLYHNATPELQMWWKEEERQFRLNREIWNAMGRRFRVFERIDDDVLETIVAFYPQSTIGDKITQVWYASEEDDDWPDRRYARIAIDVHDNLVGITVPKYAKTTLKVLKKYAEEPIWIQDVYKRRKHEPLSIPAELKMSYPTSWDAKKRIFVPDEKGLHRWSEMKKVEL